MNPSLCFSTSPDTDLTELIWKGVRFKPNPVTPSNRPGIYGTAFSAEKNYIKNDTVCNKNELTAWVCNIQIACSKSPPSNINLQKDWQVWRFYSEQECINKEADSLSDTTPKSVVCKDFRDWFFTVPVSKGEAYCREGKVYKCGNSDIC